MRPPGRATGRNQHQEVAREYRRLAARYDARWAGYIAATVRETLRRMPPDLGARALDVACGTGALLAALNVAHPDVRFAGIDLSPDMLAVARRKLPRRVALQVAAAEALPFPDGAFDTVVSTNSFHFFPEPQAALAEMHRVLRPGGALVVTDWCDDYLACRICDRLLRLSSAAHHRIYGAAECRELIAGAGFEAVSVDRYKIDWLWGLMTATARKPLR